MRWVCGFSGVCGCVCDYVHVFVVVCVSACIFVCGSVCLSDSESEYPYVSGIYLFNDI